jgi:CRISPR system Cascade subunit CasC
MNLIELHILQSFPVSCLNRDDLGSPKSAIFGGAERARVSSQCWKRAVRSLAHEKQPELFAGIRSKLVGPQVLEAAKRLGCSEERGNAYATIIINTLNKGKDSDEVKALFYFSPRTMEKIVQDLHESNKITDKMIKAISSDDKKTAEKGLKDTIAAAGKILTKAGSEVSDAADIALFGRMVANPPDLTIDGATMFSHALSTHAVRSDLDFFSAIDDVTQTSAHIDTAEFNSACYYRYVGINLDLLQQSKMFDQTQYKEVLKTFIEATVMGNPVARKNSMFAYSLPAFILGIRRQGQPLSLANAFEEPVRQSKNGYVAQSIEKLIAEWNHLKKTFALTAEAEIMVGKERSTLPELINKMTAESNEP